MQKSPFKIAVNYGAMSGLACFAMFLLLYYSGLNPIGPASWLAVWIPPLFIFLAIRRFRDVELAGFINYSSALMTGIFTATSGALLYALIVYIFGTLIDPAMIDNFKEMMLADFEKSEEMMRSIIGDSMYEQSLEEMKKTTLKSIAMNDFFTKCMGGGIISVIAAAIMKRKPPEVI